ncbi:hypothetical protein Tsp_00697 [Trichinella spiralis]|nr:hypothetical protein Tsp_00697 [Trichinella spiralis]
MKFLLRSPVMHVIIKYKICNNFNPASNLCMDKSPSLYTV